MAKVPSKDMDKDFLQTEEHGEEFIFNGGFISDGFEFHCLHIAVSLPRSLSPLQEWQFIPLLCLLLRLYLSVWRSRPTDYWHHWLGNMVSILCFYSFCYLYECVLKFTHIVTVLFSQWLDLSFNWSEHQYPSGHHHVIDRSSVHCSVCGLAHYV